LSRKFHLALAVQGDILADMARDRFEAELLEGLAERQRIACGELHELESSGAERIVLRVCCGLQAQRSGWASRWTWQSPVDHS